MSDTIFIGGAGEGYAAPETLILKYANRHGLIAGATGTGKTVTVQIMAQAFADAAGSGVRVGCQRRSVGTGCGWGRDS
ncbi:uncharacterized protein DUF853 [Donghicola tyrosinivorans]|uniref:Uncharacterized protein DUF853 n=1 Tax=Donghicola tyrosinivorans TaxID=1652492 RepID=A0A2T0WTM2_9RHOB|nr:uncharacterized protein DUF853 [Donghicola tyrosinivorans]